jgi:uncharacterized protein YerC
VKKKDVLNLVKYHCEGNDIAFRDTANQIAREFDTSGDYQLADYIMAQLSDANAFMPQSDDNEPVFLVRMHLDYSKIALPKAISADMLGVRNAIQREAGLSKFLLQGPPGTGKTESVKHLAHLLDRELLAVNFDSIIDSKLGQTSKNIGMLFNEIRSFACPEKLLFLFDEIDALALDRINANDVREMGRATSSFLKEFDQLGETFIVFATTNLYDAFDKALIRRFDACIDFGRYSGEDLIDLSEFLMEELLRKYSFIGRDMRLFHKIMESATNLPFPGELKNMLKTCIAFSDVDDEFDYLRRIFKTIRNEEPSNVQRLYKQGFTVREIERLSGISKSTVARSVKGVPDESSS